MHLKFGMIEFFFTQLIVYSLIWLSSEYIGFFITLTFPILILAILVISLVVELIEPSRVPKAYYKFMINAILAPLVVLAFFTIIHQGHWSWMDSI
jgi:hypothetical protein